MNSGDRSMPDLHLGPDDPAPSAMGTLETIPLPTAGLYVNVDVNDLLESMTEEQMFMLLGKLKDLLA